LSKYNLFQHVLRLDTSWLRRTSAGGVNADALEVTCQVDAKKEDANRLDNAPLEGIVVDARRVLFHLLKVTGH